MIGSFEQLILVAVLRLGDNAYGMAIREEIEERTGIRPSLGAVYSTLDRLQAKGFLGVQGRPGGPARGGRPRKFFRIEPTGRQALNDSLESLERMLDGLALRDLGRSRA